MPNNCLSVLYKRIIQVENKNMGLKVGGGGHKHTIAPQSKKWGGGTCPPCPPPPPPPPPLPTPVYKDMQICLRKLCEDRAAGKKTIPDLLRGVGHNIRLKPVNRDNCD